jgi:hypothetical protein
MSGTLNNQTNNHQETPRTVTHIGVDAFQGCTGLRPITIPQSVIEIGLDAFDRSRTTITQAVRSTVDSDSSPRPQR